MLNIRMLNGLMNEMIEKSMSDEQMADLTDGRMIRWLTHVM